MSFLLFGLLLLHLSSCGFSKPSRLEEKVGGDLEETTYTSGIDKKVEELLQRMERMENELETKNVEVENLENKLKMECKAEVEKELDKVLPTAVEQGLRDLPFEMVCVFREKTDEANSVVSYDKITVEFNNSDRPGGADGSMNIVTGVFTAVTSGYYIVTFSGWVRVNAGGETVIT